ncbi:MAG: glycoside hydrolase family 9 protein [Ignavibacteriae bacterium]|nr:glycoside hydrolase family 9 protein [Ignavibacteriota bacterium]
MRVTNALLVAAAILLFACRVAYAQEPSGGVIRDLAFFRDALNDTIRYHPYSCSGPTLSSNPVYAGTRSLKFVAGSTYAGVQMFWAGNTNPNDWWGSDTSVFWAHSDSRLTFWVYSSTNGNVIGVTAYGFNTSYGGVGSATIAARNTWQRVDMPIPSNLLNLPLKGFEINFGNATPTIYFDELQISNVRMFAGTPPPPPANFQYIAASQIGYAPDMKKQFSSPTDFTSFTIVRVSDNAVVFTGGAPGRTVTSSVIGNSAVYIGDFTALTTEGRYKIVANGKESLPFNISPSVFAGPVRAAQRFFYYQRAFTAIESPYAEGPWVHPTDVAKAPAGVVKGWHDAGDLTIYMPTMTQSLWWQLETWTDFQPTNDDVNIPESGNGIPDLLDETRWGLEWVRSQQDPNGGFWANSCAGGNNSYPYGSTTPNTVGNYTKTVAPTAQNTAKAIAVLAYASKVYQPYDAAFAASCLSAARAGWTWLAANPNATNDADGGNCGVYAQGNDAALLKTNKMWAAAAMLYATGESQYETAFQSNYSAISWISSYSKSDAFAGKMYLRCTTGANSSTQNAIRQSIFQFADGVRADANAHPFQWATHYYWGSNSNGAHRTGQFSWQAFRMDETRTADRDALLDNVHYMFGRNYLNISYMSGSDAFGATQYRREGFHHWMKALQATPFHFPGAVAGGPNEAPSTNDVSYPSATPYPVYGYFGDPRYPRDGTTPIDGRFTDNDSWSTNEICVNWQGAILYNLYAAHWVANGGGPIGPRDTLPPVISNVQSTSIVSSSASVTWRTDEPSTSIVEYGTTTLYGSSASAAGNVTNHSVPLSGLTSNTMYYYRVRSSDASGNTSYSTGHSFITGMAATYAPTGATILAGTLSAGSYVDLASNNSQYFAVRGASTTPSMSWYGSVIISQSAANVIQLTVTYDGKSSKANTQQVLSLYNWSTSSWTQIDSRTIGTSDVTVTVVRNSPAAFVSSSGQIRLLVTCNGPGPARTGSGDFMRFAIESAGASVSERGGGEPAGLRMSPSNAFTLNQNFPNPFNPATTIGFAVPADQRVLLKVYDLLGREVATLIDDVVPAGHHEAVFDASNLSSGFYMYRLSVGRLVKTNRMILMK